MWSVSAGRRLAVADQVEVLLRRPRQDPDQHDPLGVHAHDLGHRRLGILVAHQKVGPDDEIHPGPEVSPVGVRQPVTVGPVVVNPQVPIHHDAGYAYHHRSARRRPGRIRLRRIEAESSLSRVLSITSGRTTS